MDTLHSENKRLALRFGIAIFLLAMLVRLGYFVKYERYNVMLRSEVEQVAMSLAKSNDFANPYARPTGPTAHVAPAYPFLLSLLYRALGTGMEAEVAEQLIMLTGASASFALLPAVAVVCGMPLAAGAIAGAVGALSPIHLVVETQGKEAVLTGLVVMALFVLTLRSAWSWRQGLLHGVCWGLAFLVSPALLPVLLLWLAVAAWRSQAGWRYPAVLALTACVVILPWMVRNRQQFQAWFFIRDNFGLEVSLSHSEEQLYSMMDKQQLSAAARRHPWGNPAETERVIALGELAYHRQKLAGAMAWASANPGESARRLAVRAGQFWFLPWPKTMFRLASWAVVVGALIGMLWFVRQACLAGWLLAGLWLAYPLAYYLVMVDNRYRYPMEWSLYLMLGYAGARMLGLARPVT